jgi:hypothetical protein
MNNKSENREFKRHAIDFMLEVSGEYTAGNKYKDKAIVVNVSGEGAMFITRLADKYFLDQSLELIIYLPGTDDVNARMRGKVTVVRIESLVDSGIKEKDQRISIAVRLDMPFCFERVV